MPVSKQEVLMSEILLLLGVAILGGLLWYWILDNYEPAEYRCKSCHKVTSPYLCLMCGGKGEWEPHFREFRKCRHRRFVIQNWIQCRLCRPSVA